MSHYGNFAVEFNGSYETKEEGFLKSSYLDHRLPSHCFLLILECSFSLILCLSQLKRNYTGQDKSSLFFPQIHFAIL